MYNIYVHIYRSICIILCVFVCVCLFPLFISLTFCIARIHVCKSLSQSLFLPISAYLCVSFCLQLSLVRVVYLYTCLCLSVCLSLGHALSKRINDIVFLH